MARRENFVQTEGDNIVSCKGREFGVIYVAMGRPYLAMALNSLRSLRSTNPAVPACILTNVLKEPPPAQAWLHDKLYQWRFMDIKSEQNRLIKTEIINYTPFDKTVFLDCDTIVLSKIEGISLFLDYFDLCLWNRGDSIKSRKRLLSEGVPACELPHWNGGVIGFRHNSRAAEFFRIWNERYRELGSARDQMSLVEAIFFSAPRILPLGDDWNTPDRIFARRELRNATKIWHYKSDIDGRLERDIMMADEWLEQDGSMRDFQSTKAYIVSRQLEYRRSRGFIKKWLGRALKRLRGSLTETVR